MSHRCILVLCAVLSTVLDVNSQPAQYCPDRWFSHVTGGTTTCLWLSNEKVSWTSAHTWCNIMQGNLVEIDSPALNSKLAMLITGKLNGKYWIGLTDMEAETAYTWSASRRPASVHNFPPGQSIGDIHKNCVHVDEKGLWGVESCKAEFWFICQRKI
ncbi:lymphocyte antigen 75-like [Dreissena polymorpha]|uniref:C-type lectin domain-containing protein n=1 Tax=Dreissena polymorpha TaxID=45954 RepID=A0A9D4G6K6_DREPO|nr:lymphocyte antigen 75-like [Dreissena polymorpha]KAH3809505.1 hypothetical protein DPMN_137876 [Dreissena polymorpha]